MEAEEVVQNLIGGVSDPFGALVCHEQMHFVIEAPKMLKKKVTPRNDLYCTFKSHNVR